MTASHHSNTPAPALRAGLPWRILALLLLFLAGAVVSCWMLARARAPLSFETFEARVEGAAAVPFDRIRLAARERHAVHFLLLHGYGANRRQLRQLAEVLAMAGGDVYVPDLPGRGDHPGRVTPLPRGGFNASMDTSRETRAARAVVRELRRVFRVPRHRLVLVGHSMGGGVALDLAQNVHPAATVSLSGLRRAVAPGRPRNLLLVTAVLDIPPLEDAANKMHEQASGGRVDRREFLATHASLPFHPGVQRAIVEWANRAVRDAELEIPSTVNAKLLGLTAAAVFFLAALFTPLAGLAGWFLLREPFGEIVPESRFSAWSPLHLAGYALATGLVGVTLIFLLRLAGLGPPLAFLRLAGGSYLASLLLFSTLGLLPVLRQPPWVRDWRETGGKLAATLLLAAYVILAGGAFAAWQLYDLWPTGDRWWRFVLLALILLPYALGEEFLVRTFAKRERGGTALSAFLLWRVMLLAAVFFGVLVFSNGQEMLVVLTLPLVLLSLAEWYFVESAYRALASPFAAALLKALLIAWILSTIFPLQ